MAPLLMALGVFVVGAVVVFGAYLLLAGMPQWMVQRKIQRRMDDVGLAFKPEAVEATLVKGQIRGAAARARPAHAGHGGRLVARAPDRSVRREGRRQHRAAGRARPRRRDRLRAGRDPRASRWA